MYQQLLMRMYFEEKLGYHKAEGENGWYTNEGFNLYTWQAWPVLTSATDQLLGSQEGVDVEAVLNQMVNDINNAVKEVQ